MSWRWAWVLVFTACERPRDVSTKPGAAVTSLAASASVKPAASNVASPALPVASVPAPVVASERPPRRPVERLMRLYSSVSVREAVPVKPEPATAELVLEIERRIAGKRELKVDLEAFDARTLHYVLLREDRSYGPKIVRVVERRLIVRRSLEAEHKLGLASLIDFYERGDRGVLGGARPEEVVKAWGEAPHAVTLGTLGNCDWIYADREVRFLGGVVAFTRDQARRPQEMPHSLGPASKARCLSLSGY